MKYCSSEIINGIINSIRPSNKKIFSDILEYQNSLTKPEGSLGILETLSAQVASIRNSYHPTCEKKTAILMVSDHGVAIEGVSAYPQTVTQQMLLNFSTGGAAVNVFANSVGCKLRIVDIGTNSNDNVIKNVHVDKISKGTQNMLKGPAMTRREAELGIEKGIMHFLIEFENKIDLLAIGEMGISNTTASSAITSVLCERKPIEVTGPGTGLNELGLKRKISVIEKSIETNQPNPNDPIDVLSKLGGFEIAGLVGVILAAVSKQIPVILDGFITGVAGLVAVKINPLCKDFLIAGHLSTEPGHIIILNSLDLRPILQFNLRLGEGTGAILSMQIIDVACKILSQMATFDSANVSKKI